MLLDYRISVSSLTLVARQESAARARIGQPIAPRSTSGVAVESENGGLVSWTEGGQRYELASPDLDVVALVRLAATLAAEP